MISGRATPLTKTMHFTKNIHTSYLTGIFQKIEINQLLKLWEGFQKYRFLPHLCRLAAKVNHAVGNSNVLGVNGHVVNRYLIECFLRELDRGRFAFNQHPRFALAVENQYV